MLAFLICKSLDTAGFLQQKKGGPGKAKGGPGKVKGGEKLGLMIA